MEQIKKSINEILTLESQIRDAQRELREGKADLLRFILNDIGPEEAVRFGYVTLNIRKIASTFR